MSQRVIITLGDPVEAGAMQDIIKSLSDPGILRGFELTSPARNIVSLTPGSAVTDSGVLIIDDEYTSPEYPTSEQVFNLTTAPANYTVYYSYIPTTSFGGNPARLMIQSGILDPKEFKNGVIVGWIKYPGNSIPLDNSMFISGPRFRLTQPIEQQKGEYQIAFYGPFSNKWSLISATGPALTIQDSWSPVYLSPVTKAINLGVSLARSKFAIPFKVPSGGVGRVAIEVQSDSGTNVTLQLQDKSGNLINPVEMNFFTNTDMDTHVLTIPYAAGLTPNSQAFIVLSFDIQPTYSAVLKSLLISSYVEPV